MKPIFKSSLTLAFSFLAPEQCFPALRACDRPLKLGCINVIFAQPVPHIPGFSSFRPLVSLLLLPVIFLVARLPRQRGREPATDVNHRLPGGFHKLEPDGGYIHLLVLKQREEGREGLGACLSFLSEEIQI